jgi:DNA invertase Pin-like site-specific DNA recombinase
MDGRFVSYLRVSTERQGKSGLGLEAQRAACAAFLNGGDWSLNAEYIEVESGKRSDRPKLNEALQACRVTGSTLLIAKLDRLGRDAHFLLGLQKAGVPFRAADMPQADAFMIGVMAMVAQREREMISERTTAALAAAKARGVKMGGFRGHKVDWSLSVAARRAAADEFAAMIGPMVAAMRAEGLTLQAIADRLIAQKVRTAGGGTWTSTAVRAVMLRFEAMKAKGGD